MKIDRQKSAELKREAHRRGIRRFWSAVSVEMGTKSSYGSTISRRIKHGNNFDDWTITRMEVAIGKVLGRTIALVDFVCSEDIPASAADKNSDVKEVGSAFQ